MAQLPPGFVLDSQPQQRGIVDELGHQTGLAGRYILEGAGDMANILTEPIRNFVTDPISRKLGMLSDGPTLSGLITGEQKPERSMSTGELMASLSDSLGLPKPEGKLEEGIGHISKALVGTGLTMGTSNALGAAKMAEQPLMQAISTMTGAGSQEIAKESGAGPGGQMVAGLVGGFAPAIPAATAGGVRMALRGNESGRQNMVRNIENFAGAGTTPSVGQASESAVPQYLESLLAKLPGSASVMAKKAANQADEIGAGLSAKANALSPGADAEAAGNAIQQGIAGPGGFVEQFRKEAGKLYDQLDQHMPAQTPIPVSATKNFLAEAVAPTKGAQSTSSLLVNPKLKEIDSALSTDLADAASGTLPYEAVKSLRSRVGGMIANAGLTPDIPKGELKRLYGALSQDINAQAAKNPLAAKAANRADNFYREGIQKIDKLEHVINKAGGPEKVFSAAMAGTSEGATTLRNVMSGLKKSERDTVTATVINRMGKATAGQQGTDAAGMADRFSMSTFLTNWSKMSPQARSVLFDHKGPKFREDMNKLAQVATNLRDGSKVFANNSGSSQGATQIGTSAAFVMSALGGHPGTAALIAGGAAGANLSARLMTNPKFVGWLAKQTNRPLGTLPGQIGTLSSIGKDDPDVQEFIATLARAGNQSQQ